MIHPFFFILGFWVMLFLVVYFFLDVYDNWQWMNSYRRAYKEKLA